ncbi:MAG: prenyltransferase/squalene oxidase repeat-containing protein [Candidatus Heimdallarchaeota archaeon]
MKLKYNPFPLIFTQGDAVTKLACLEIFDLIDSPLGKECVLKLIMQQHSDGSFPSHLDPLNWGIRETVRNTHLMLKVGLPRDGVNVKSAVKFILNHQNPDGGWSENRLLTIPQQIVELSNERSITWITADIVELMRQLAMEEYKEFRAAVKWLTTMQNRHGGWYCFSGSIGERLNTEGDPDSTAQITFLLGEIYGKDTPAYINGRKLLERFLDDSIQDIERGYRIKLRDGTKEDLDVYYLTHLLLSSLVDLPRRIEEGYNVSDPRVKRMMEVLIEIQREDGGWQPFWAEISDPTYTVLGVKTLILSGTILPKDLEVDIKTFII